jgi:sulfonate transport system permease protein
MAASHFGWVTPHLLTSPQSLLEVPWDPEFGPALAIGLAASLARMALGAGIGCVLGLGFGIFLGISARGNRVFGPSFHAIRQVAVFAWVPLLTAWAGNGEVAKVIMIAISAFYPTVMNTYQGIHSVPRHYMEVAEAFCFSRRRLLRRVILPAAAPAIMTGLQLALIYTWIGTIGAEYLMGMSHGIGTFVSEGRERFRMDVVMLGIVVIGGLGFILNRVLDTIGGRLLRWRDISS